MSRENTFNPEKALDIGMVSITPHLASNPAYWAVTLLNDESLVLSTTSLKELLDKFYYLNNRAEIKLLDNAFIHKQLHCPFCNEQVDELVRK